MERFERKLGPALLGGEVLVQLARNRVDGVLTWNTANTEAQLFFKAGRPEQAMFQGQISATRQQVTGFVRGLTVLLDGICIFEPKAVEVPGGLGIDTLGEVLVAMMTTLKPAQLATIWSVRGGLEVEPQPTFDKLAAAVVKVGGPEMRRPLPGSAMAALVAGASTEAQCAWTTLLILGALKVLNPAAIEEPESKRPTAGHLRKKEPEKEQARIDPAPSTAKDEAAPSSQGKPPKDPVARRVFFDAKKAHKALADKNHYQVLGVAADANADAIKKTYFERAREWHSDSFSGLKLPPETLSQIADIFGAVEDAYHVLADPNERKTYDYILDRRAKGLPTDPKVIMEAEGLFSKAQALVRKGEAAEAVSLLRKAVELNHGEAEFWAYLGFAVHSKEGRTALAEARDHLRKALELNERLAVAYELRGRIERVEGNLQAAQRDLKRALELNPKNVDAQREMRLLTMRGATNDKKGGHSDHPIAGLLGKVFKR